MAEMPPEQVERDFFDILPCYPAQRDFIGGNMHAPNHLWLGGVGTGKTTSLVYATLLLAQLNPGHDVCLFGRTGPDLTTILIPLFFHALELWQDATGDELLAGGKGYNKTTRIARMKGTGTRILFRPYDRIDKVRGMTLAAAMVDEIEFATVSSLEAFMVIQSRIRAPGAPYRQMKIATTPNGLQGCTAHFLEKQREENKRYRCIRATVHDNPYLDAEYIENLRAACTPRQWKQEGEGRILKPTMAVFSEFDEEVHVVPFSWPLDCKDPYILIVDWGTSHAYFAAIVVDASGRWVVAYEEKKEDTSSARFRKALVDFVDSRGQEPELIATDRAKPKENAWAVGTFRESWVRSMESKGEQSIINGVEAVRFMLDPLEGPPRLYFSDQLKGGINEKGRGLRGAMVFYRNVVDKNGVATNQPLKDNVNDHPIDALRYGVIASADRPKLHGGAMLPFILPTRRQDRHEPRMVH